MNDHFLAAALLALTVFAAELSPAKAQDEAAEKKKPAPQALAPAPDESGAAVAAVLVDADAKAKKRAAVVQAKATGVKIVDPALARERPVAGQGHFHFRVDDGPVIATTASKLSFHGLETGRHEIVVELAGNDHKPIAKPAELAVTVP